MNGRSPSGESSAIARFRGSAPGSAGAGPVRNSLELWCFQANSRARRFYEARGFHAILFTDGAGNEERTPDVRYRWERPSN
jgi:hypothetical protein